MDDGTKKSRYSVLKSAATIALLSIAIAAVTATAGAALLPEVAAVEAVSQTPHFGCGKQRCHCSIPGEVG